MPNISRKVSRKSRKVSRKSRKNQRHPILRYKMMSDNEDQKEDSIEVLFSCTSYLENSDLMKNIISILKPFLMYSRSDKIINITMINGYRHKEGVDDINKTKEEKIKYIAKLVGLNVVFNPMIYERFIDHIFKMSLQSFFYDYICFIGCNNIDFLFSFFGNGNDEDKHKLSSKIGIEDKEYFESFEQYAVTQNLNLFLKPCSKILFFEKGRYWDEINFHSHLLNPMSKAKKHAEIFLENFELKIFPTSNIPYFIYKNR